MGIRASLSFRYIAPTTRTAKSSILTPKIAKIPFCRDRIAPNCTHPPPKSGQLWHCRDGWDFPRGWRGFVEIGVTRDALAGLNWPHFRFSSLISIFECHVCAKGGEWVADRGPCSVGKEGGPRGPESRPGLLWRSRLARSGPGAARAWVQVSARERWHPVAGRCFPLRVRGTRIADIASDKPQIWGSPLGR